MKSAISMEETVRSLKPRERIPGLIDIAERSKDRGDFSRAQRMFRAELNSALREPNGDKDVVGILIYIAKSYFDDANYDEAEKWYRRAFNLSVRVHGEFNLQSACLLILIAEVNALQSKFDKSERLFEQVKRTYLLCADINTNDFCNCLIDLSSTLCLMNKASQAREVNDFVAMVSTEITSVESIDDKAGG